MTEIRAELVYRNPEAAIAWLEKAFGFEPALQVTGADGRIVHAQMVFAGEEIHLGPEAPPSLLSPASTGGVSTASVMIRSAEDVAAHCERARAAGAAILWELRREFYGDDTYRACDPQGHVFTFARTNPGRGGPPPEGWRVSLPNRRGS